MSTEQPDRRCVACGGEMAPGFLGDRAVGGTHNTTWVEGEPRMGLAGVRTLGRSRAPVIAYRCRDCARLELFAEPLE